MELQPGRFEAHKGRSNADRKGHEHAGGRLSHRKLPCGANAVGIDSRLDRFVPVCRLFHMPCPIPRALRNRQAPRPRRPQAPQTIPIFNPKRPDQTPPETLNVLSDCSTTDSRHRSVRFAAKKQESGFRLSGDVGIQGRVHADELDAGHVRQHLLRVVDDGEHLLDAGGFAVMLCLLHGPSVEIYEGGSGD